VSAWDGVVVEAGWPRIGSEAVAGVGRKGGKQS
jgi:hypothetical protein